MVDMCHFDMNKKQKRIQIFLAISFIFFFLVSSSYLYYSNYIENDFLPAKPTFDNLDPDYLLTNQQNKSFAFGQNISLFIIETYLFQQLPHLYSGISSLSQKLFVLRC
jgi:hypothetical protein